MHPRNPYNSQLDFVSLADSFPPLNNFLLRAADGSIILNFRDAQTQRCLTEALLYRDFGLSINLPEDRLCPPVPNRLNYLLWIQDVLTESARYAPFDGQVTGVDIGTGASAIYPLLGCKISPSWNFVGTEIDSVSYASAVENVARNNLNSRISIMSVTQSSHIFAPLFERTDSRYTFTMCNPPFYSSKADILRSAEGKAVEPSSVCTGADVEMITPGGEEAFVGEMVKESMSEDVGRRSLWFTSMLGKLSSLYHIVSLLRQSEIDNYAVTELVQGQTRRWVVAWSFSDVRLPDNLARALPNAHSALLPLPNTLKQPLYSLLRPPNSNSESYSFISRPNCDSVDGTGDHHSTSDGINNLFERIQIRGKDLRRALEAVLDGLDDISYSFSTELRDKSGSGEEKRQATTKQEEEEGQDGDGVVAFKVIVQATRDTWSRKARRRAQKRKRDHLDATSGTKTAGAEATLPLVAEPIRTSTPVLIVEISAYILHRPEPEPEPTTEVENSSHHDSDSISSGCHHYQSDVGEEQDHQLGVLQDAHPARAWMLTCTWRRGSVMKNAQRSEEGEGGRALFEGFWSHVCRKLGVSLLDEGGVGTSSMCEPTKPPLGDGNSEHKKKGKRRRER